MRCLIIGNGAAGVNTARLLRGKNRDIEIEILTEEEFPYYSRINLIEFLAGDIPQEKLIVFSKQWYEDRKIKVRYGTIVQAIDSQNRRAILKSGQALPFDYLLIATGSYAFRPPVPNIELAGIFTLRSLVDAQAIRAYAAAGARRALVLGGGLLGLESAYSLKRLGLEVTVLENADRLLPRQLDAEGATVLSAILADRGLQLEVGASAKAFHGDGAVTGLQLKDGRTLPADLVLVSTGVQPNIACLEGSGIAVDRGVLVDDQMQSNVPGIYAAGDVAQWKERMWGIVQVALNQATVVAAAIAGEHKLYAGTVPSNTLKVMGVDLAVFGEAQLSGADCVHVRVNDAENKSYAKVVLQDDYVAGAIAIGRKDMQTKLAKLVETHQPMNPTAAKGLLEEPGNRL